MLFQFNLTLTEEDYFAFNAFHAFESTHGKKMINKSRISYISITAILIALVIFVLGWTTFSIIYTTFLCLFTTLYILLFRKMLNRRIKVQIKRLQKIGKLPFDPVSTLEFYEDRILEITPSKRIEQSYNILERICIFEDRYIFLYTSSINAYILPISQIKTQANPNHLLSFLSGKCSTIENY